MDDLKELEKQVCGIEFAKRLEELGVKQESLWRWNFWDGNRHKEIPNIKLKGWGIYNEGYYSAFTVAELGVMLPSVVYDKVQKEYTLAIYKNGEHWNLTYDWDDGYDGGNCLKCFEANTEANARAKMLIYLIENKLMKVSNG